MKKSILSVGSALNKAEQKNINGGRGGCDIAPPACPCHVTPGHPCLKGGTGNGESTGVCFTPFGTTTVLCNSKCPDGSQPICL
ncbi:hypothetical protein [Tenacibaculum ovolyticum]|uniref:hypothetical protein n=1 Tax=Tenacibaculum ovolyticum TaxID=104270 RepID=UPI0007ECB58A|nr:hypothetical protein [Tenacibaculum ovolyticum]